MTNTVYIPHGIPNLHTAGELMQYLNTATEPLPFEMHLCGDCAKLREALCDMLNAAFVVILRHGNATEEMGRLALCADNAKAALAEPPRNCDKYPTFNDAIRALADKRGWHDAKWDSERYCILASWLYAPYEEGGNDGNE